MALQRYGCPICYPKFVCTNAGFGPSDGRFGGLNVSGHTPFAPGSFTQPFLEIGDAVPADEHLLTRFGHQVQFQLAPRVGMHSLDGS